MVKHTQIIRRQQPLSVFDHVAELALQGLRQLLLHFFYEKQTEDNSNVNSNNIDIDYKELSVTKKYFDIHHF